MTMMTEAEAKKILDKVLSFSKADECTVQLNGGREGNIRFARNTVSTSGVVDDVQLAVSVAFGTRSAAVTTNDLSDAALMSAVKRAEELAKLAPENPEFMPAIEKQTYKASDTFAQSTADMTPADRAQAAADSLEPCRKKGLIAAGFLQDNVGFVAHANSKGVFGYQRQSGVDFTCTVRTEDGRGSGWVSKNVDDVKRMSTAKSSEIAIRKAEGSVDAKALEPGRYTVILEPSAAAGIINMMLGGFDARNADEGRSFMSKKGGGTRLGEKFFDERINIVTDPWHPDVPVLPWDGQGMAREKMDIVKNGVVNYLQYSRYWAKLKEQKAKAQPGNMIMAGGTKTLDEMIKSTKKGILMTRSWYIRMVDPQSVLVTGLTRDGTFYIEDGKIMYPVKNFRFNESPITMLNNVEELGITERIAGDEANIIMMIPPMKIRDFNFTSLSDAV